MKETKNYKLKLPEQADNIDIDVLDENFTKLDSELAKTDKNASDHAGDKNNPHEVSKKQLGLDKVENKSSADIRSEMTKKNVTDALGYTPPNGNAASQSTAGLMTAADKKKLDEMEAGAQAHKSPTSNEVTNALGFTPARSSHSHSISSITGLEDRLQLIEDLLSASMHKLVIDYTLVGTPTTSYGSSGDSYTTYTFDIYAYKDGKQILSNRNKTVTVYSNSSLCPYIMSYNGEDSIDVSLGVKMNGYKEPWYGRSPWYTFSNAYSSQTVTIFYSPSSDEDSNADIIKIIEE